MTASTSPRTSNRTGVAFAASRARSASRAEPPAVGTTHRRRRRARPPSRRSADVRSRGELSASRGSWTGGGLSFAYRWVRCSPTGGLPDGSDCTSIAGANGSRYVLTGSDVGFRLRVRVTATNSEGSRTSASNPTALVVGPPVNTSIPIATGQPLVDATITVQPGSGGTTADRLLVRLGALQHGRRRLRRDPRSDGPHVPPDVERREPQGPLQRHREECSGRDDGALVRVRRGGGSAASGRDQAAGWRRVDPADERAGRPAADRLAGGLRASHRAEQRRAGHRAREGRRHPRIPRARRRRVRALDAEGDLGRGCSRAWTAG